MVTARKGQEFSLGMRNAFIVEAPDSIMLYYNSTQNNAHITACRGTSYFMADIEGVWINKQDNMDGKKSSIKQDATKK